MSVGDDLSEWKEATQKALSKPFGAVLKISILGGPALLIDGRSDPPIISNADAQKVQPDCYLRGDQEILKSVLSGRRAIEKAYISGRLSIAGDMSVMTRLDLEPLR